VSRDPEFYYTQAERLVSEGRLPAAELMLRQAAELGGTNRVYVAALAALLSLQEGRGEESLALVSEHLQENPDEPSLLIAKAMAARSLGQSETAEEALRHAVRSDSGHAFAHHSLSKLLIESGRGEEAEPHACKAFALVPDQPDYALTAIELLEASGKHDYAFEVASLGASFCPEEMELVQRAVQGALVREEPERAWETLAESNQDLPWVLGWKATLLEHQGDSEQADELLALGRERFPEDSDFLYLEAAIWARREQFEEALMVLSQLLEQHPSHRAALRLRADLCFSQADTDEALANLQAMLAIEPNDWEVACELVAVYYRARRYREALDACEQFEAQPLVKLYQMLSLAGQSETQESLAMAAELPAELVELALSELNTYGLGNQSETALREKLELLAPEPVEAAVEIESEEESETEALSEDDSSDLEPESAEPEGDLPEEAPEGFSWIEEDEEDVDEDEVWVEIDEETGEEYVWVDDDEEEE
jgi:Flp pilus assembly protein TadD